MSAGIEANIGSSKPNDRQQLKPPEERIAELSPAWDKEVRVTLRVDTAILIRAYILDAPESAIRDNILNRIKEEIPALYEKVSE